MNVERRQISFFASEGFAKSIEQTAEKYRMKRGEFIKWALKSFIASQNTTGIMLTDKPLLSNNVSDFNGDKPFSLEEV